MDKSLLPILEAIGVRGTDATIYLTALRLGPTTIVNLARMSKVQRVTVYAALERLRRRGLVSESVRPRSRTVAVESPRRLLALSKEQQRSLETAEEQLRTDLPSLLARFQRQGPYPRVRLFEGKEQFIAVFDEILEEAENGPLYFFGDASLFVDTVSKEFERDWIRRRIRKRLAIKILVHSSSLTKEFQRNDRRELRDTRFLPKETSFQGSFLLAGTKLILWNPTLPVAIAIDDEIIAEMHSAMFLILWQQAINPSV